MCVCVCLYVCIYQTKIPIQIIASAQMSLSKIQGNAASVARKKIAIVLARARLPPSTLPPDQLRALRTLKQRDDIVILPAHKGRATVVMDRCDYDDKMNAMLEDEEIYRQLSRDPVKSVERRMNAMLLKKKEGSISPELYK